MKNKDPSQRPDSAANAVASSSPFLLSSQLKDLSFTLSPDRKKTKGDLAVESNLNQSFEFMDGDSEDDDWFNHLEQVEACTFNEQAENHASLVPTNAQCAPSGPAPTISPVDSTFDALDDSMLSLGSTPNGPKAASQPATPVTILSLSQLTGRVHMVTGAAAEHRIVPHHMLPEGFALEQFLRNIASIAWPKLQVACASGSRIVGPFALLVKDFRLIGNSFQVKLLSASGEEVMGTLACLVLGKFQTKLHFGQIFILENVSVYSPIPSVRYLNVTAGNVLAVYANVKDVS